MACDNQIFGRWGPFPRKFWKSPRLVSPSFPLNIFENEEKERILCILSNFFIILRHRFLGPVGKAPSSAQACLASPHVAM